MLKKTETEKKEKKNEEKEKNIGIRITFKITINDYDMDLHGSRPNILDDLKQNKQREEKMYLNKNGVTWMKLVLQKSTDIYTTNVQHFLYFNKKKHQILKSMK